MQRYIRHFFGTVTFIAIWSVGLAQQNNRPKVVATTTFLADMTRNIAGGEAEVISLMPVNEDPHTYEPVPGDARRIAEADLIIKNGLTLEGWLDEMINSSGTQADILVATNGIYPIQSADHVGATDPHAWMDVRNGLIYITNIRDALIRLLPNKGADISQNHDRYQQKLLELDAYIQSQIQSIPPQQRIIATTHDAFRYFGNRYGLKVESILGTSTDSEARIADYQRLVRQIEVAGVPAVFIESTLDPKALQQLAEDLGITVGGKLFADSLGDEDSGAETYLKMLRQNAEVIARGLRMPLTPYKSETNFTAFLVVLVMFGISFFLVLFRLRGQAAENLNWNDYLISVDGLSVSYDRKTVLSNIYLRIEPGFVYGLIGGNGSGKSTLFKSILGLIETDAGKIAFHNLPVDAVRKYIAYVPQKEEIDWSFPATVMDIVLMGRYPHRTVFERINTVDREKARQAMETLGILDLQNKQIGELSGGQQQRAFIARALCQEAEIYLFDEPFVGVDITTETRIMEVVQDLAVQGKTVVIIHHDLAKVNDYFDRLIMLNQRLVAFGDTEAVFTDENIKATYGGRLTILQKTEGLH